MPYDEQLARRVRAGLAEICGPGAMTEKKMFGGLAFLLAGRMVVSVGSRGGLMVRVDPAQTESFVREDLVDRFVMRGKALNGWLLVGDGAVATERALDRWLRTAVDYAGALPR